RREWCADSGPVRGRGGELDLLLAQGRWLPHRRRAGLRPDRRPARRRTRLNPSPGTRAPRAPGGHRRAPPPAHPTPGRVCPQVLRYSPVLLFVRSGGARQSAAPSTRHPGRTATATGETAMFLAVRELLYARGRFTLMGLVIALIAVLMVVLSGLTAGLVDDGVSGLKKLPAGHLAFQHEVDPGAAYSRSIVETDAAAVWAEVDGVDDAAQLGHTW